MKGSGRKDGGVRVLVGLVVVLVLAGCSEPSSPVERQEKHAGADQQTPTPTPTPTPSPGVTASLEPGTGDMDDPQVICRLNTHMETLPANEAAEFEEEFYRQVGENLDQTVAQTLDEMDVPRYEVCG